MGANSLFKLAPPQWERLCALLDQALELPVASRGAWLDALPDEDAALRGHLDRLIAHAGETAASGTSSDGPFERMPPVLAEGEPALPPVTGPYRVLRLLGEGGMGRVWLAERTDMLHGRPIALKLPHAAWRHPDLAERMAQEREVLAVLDHPNIARIYDAGLAADGQPYLALEYVEGERIDEHVRHERLGVRAIVSLFLQITSAVAHAHARLVVHRDLKPGNVLVTPEGQVRLLDFGIAKLLSPAVGGPAAELTAPTARALTPQYAAPEQILGRPIGTAADIYALGVMLHELLTGELPYRAPRDALMKLQQEIVNEEPPRPSQRVTDPVRRRLLAGDLDTVILKALKKDPAARYPTALALAADLQNWLEDRPVTARPDSAAYRARKFVRRNWIVVGLAGTAVLSLGVGLGISVWQAQRAVQEAQKATAIKDFLVGLFAANDIERADGRHKREQSVQQLLEQSASELGTGLRNQPEVQGELQRLVGSLLFNLEIKDAALRVRQQRADALARAQAPASDQVAALRELDESLRALDRMDDARKVLDAARALCVRAGRVDTPECLGAQLDLGRVEFVQRHIDASLGLVEPLFAPTAARLLEAGDLALAHETLAQLRAEQNRPEESYALFDKAVEMRRAQWGGDCVRLALMRERFARHLWYLRRLARAETEFKAAWQVTVQALGPEHVATARAEMNLGRLQSYVGTGTEGRSHLRNARDVLLAQADRMSPTDVFELQAGWASALLVDGFLAEARAPLDDAAARRARLSSQEGLDQTFELTQARWQLDTGHFDEARAQFERLRDEAIRSGGPAHPMVADRRLRLAQALMASTRFDAAGAELAAALATQDAGEAAFGSPKHRAQVLQVALWVEQGRLEQAAPLAQALEQQARRTERANQYRDVVVLLEETLGRTAAALGHPDEAARHFETAIGNLAIANADHPWLAALRGHHALALADLGKLAAARQELALAQAGLRATPLAGPQYRRPVEAAARRLAGDATHMS